MKSGERTDGDRGVDAERGRITRRRFVAGTLATGAAAAVPAAAEAKRKRRKPKPKRPSTGSVRTRRRGRRRRRLRRPDRRARRSRRRPLGDRARGPRPGRRPRLEPRSRRRRDLRARRDVRRPDPGPGDRRWRAQLGVGTFPTYDNGNDVYVDGTAPACTYSDTGADGHRAARPGRSLADLASRSSRGSTRCRSAGAGRRAVGGGAARAEWDGQTLETVDRGRTALTPAASGSSRRYGNAADLRRRASRAVAAVRAVLHRLVRATSSNPGTFERNFDTRGGGAAVAGRRRLADDRAEDGRAARARGSCSARRCAGSCRALRGVTVHLRPRDRQGQARDRRGPAGAGREDRLRAAAARSSATS